MNMLILNANSFEKAVAVGLGAGLDDMFHKNMFLTGTKVGCGKGGWDMFYNYEAKAYPLLYHEDETGSDSAVIGLLFNRKL